MLSISGATNKFPVTIRLVSNSFSGLWELSASNARESCVHVVRPYVLCSNKGRGLSAADNNRVTTIWISTPSNCCKLWGIGAEPKVLGVIGSTRLTCNWLVEGLQVVGIATSTRGKNAAQNIGSSCSNSRTNCLNWVVLVLVDNVAITVFNARNCNSITTNTACSKGCKCGALLNRGYALRTKSGRQVWL